MSSSSPRTHCTPCPTGSGVSSRLSAWKDIYHPGRTAGTPPRPPRRPNRPTAPTPDEPGDGDRPEYVRLADLGFGLVPAGLPLYGPAGGEYAPLSELADAIEMAALTAGRWV